MERTYCDYTPRYLRMGEFMMGIDGVLYTPSETPKTTGVVILHSDSDYLNFPGGAALARRGFLTLCANVENPADPLERKLGSVRRAVETMRAQPGIEKLVLLGHSGGATLMSCYQAVAENSPDIFRDGHRIVKMGAVDELPAADGIMLIDSNFGNGVMTLVSIDPGVTDESRGTGADKAYDAFATESGFIRNGETRYTEEFKNRFYAAQAARQERLIAHALERLDALENGNGAYVDDEPLIAPGASQIAPNNRLFPQDLHLLAHTKNAYDLIHGRDGSVTHEIIRSLRTARGDLYGTPIYGLGAMNTTVRTYLSSQCVRTLPGYGVKEDGIDGIDYDSAFCCTPGNVKHIHAPMLIMGMTGGYECIASEVIYENAASSDKTIAFVEGGTHMLSTAHDAEEYPDQFGDAAETLFDAIAGWLDNKF